MNKNLLKFIYKFAEKVGVIYTIHQKSPNRIVKVDDTGIFVETESSRKKYDTGEEDAPYRRIRAEWIEGALQKLLNNDKCIASDFHEYGMRHSFILAFLNELPLVEGQVDEDNDYSIKIKKFTTSDIPGPLNESMNFLGKDPENALNIPYVKLFYEVLTYLNGVNPIEKRQILLDIMFITTVSSTNKTPITESVAQRKLPDILSWLQKTDLIDGELNVIQQNSSRRTINYWWVNQGKSARSEVEGNFLWAPQRNKRGFPVPHHTDLQKAKPGDVVIAYSNTAIRYVCIVEESSIESKRPQALSEELWGDDGYLLKVRYSPLKAPIAKKDISIDLRLKENGPFNKNGDVKQGYFFSIQESSAMEILREFIERIPEEIINYCDVELSKGYDSIVKSDSELVNHIHNYISNKGFYYSQENIKNFFLSLKTKPFLILSGISGTGKTKIVKLFAESLGANEKNGQFTLIPVRPDWSDGSDLIGYEDINGNFKIGPLTKVLIEANKVENRDKPYFILLDEMNLARVEYYFSDLLSIMESREIVNNSVTSTAFIDRAETGRLILTNNIYIIGTVNMDETTHPFSKKVLDRANTLEYNNVHLDNFSIYEGLVEVKPLVISNSEIAGSFITLKDAYAAHKELIQKVTSYLVEINEILQTANLQFGYRVRDEICFYMIYNQQANLLEEKDAFDFQIHQKILPRIAGNDYKTEIVLKRLFEFCTNHVWDENISESIIEDSKYPNSASKLHNMLAEILNNSFTSFWI